MRDTLLLRARVQAAILGVPLAVTVAALGCGGGASPGEAPERRAGVNDPGKAAARPQPGRVSVSKLRSGDGDAAAGAGEEGGVRPFAESPYPERWGLDPYDPEAAEEDGCVVGDWCGPVDAARRFANPAAEDELGCPSRLLHVRDHGAKESDPVYRGFSFDPMMQGRIRRLATAAAREAQGRDDVCCYHWFNYCSGRPLLVGAAEASPGDAPTGEAELAPLVASAAWCAPGGRELEAGEAMAIELLEPGLSDYLSEVWLGDARMEHASVAAFARATLELMAVGAPPELVAGAARAGAEEVEHARLCFGLARRYAGASEEAPPQGPGPLPAVAPRALDVAGLAAVTFLEGCVGETIAALAAGRAARACRDPEVQRVLEKIASEEASHAELAWATVAWALGQGGEAVAERLQATADALRGQRASLAENDPCGFPEPLLAAHGRLGAAAWAAAQADAWDEIIEPTLAALLG